MKENWKYARGFPYVLDDINFYPSDSKELYEKNLKENYSELEKNGWISLSEDLLEKFYLDKGFNYYLYTPKKPALNDWVELSYKINSYGFRCEEMPTEKKPRSIITIGCSNTFGVGMPIGQIWPTLVGNTLKHRPYNLGIPNGSLDSAFRVLLAWLPKIRPSHVFLLEPPGVRYETHTVTFDITHSSINNPSPVGIRFEHEDEWELHREKTMRAIKSLCDQFDTPFFYMSYDSQLTTEIAEFFETPDSARDLMHPGRNAHTYIAMSMLRKAGYKWDIENK